MEVCVLSGSQTTSLELTKNYKQKQSPCLDSVSLVDVLGTISSSPPLPTPNIRLLHNGKIIAVCSFINSNKYLTRLNFCLQYVYYLQAITCPWH